MIIEIPCIARPVDNDQIELECVYFPAACPGAVAWHVSYGKWYCQISGEEASMVTDCMPASESNKRLTLRMDGNKLIEVYA